MQIKLTKKDKNNGVDWEVQRTITLNYFHAYSI